MTIVIYYCREAEVKWSGVEKEKENAQGIKTVGNAHEWSCAIL